MVPFSNYSGAELVYDGKFLSQDVRASLFYGSLTGTSTTRGSTGIITLKQILGGYLTYGAPDCQLRLEYAEGNSTSVTLPAFVPLIDAYATVYGKPDIISDYSYQNVKAYFVDAGIQYTKNDWLILAEIVQLGTNSIAINKSRAWYGTIGHKFFTNWMPFIGYSQLTTLNKSDRVYTGPLGVAINPTVAQISSDQQTGSQVFAGMWLMGQISNCRLIKSGQNMEQVDYSPMRLLNPFI